MVESQPMRWLPINILFARNMVTVKWIDFASKRLTEPFFHQTVKALRALDPPAFERSTDLSTLVELGSQVSPVRPSGLIFHVSRCGSTLLANVLRRGIGVTVLSEARPVGMFFRPNAFARSPFPREGWKDARTTLLSSVVNLYGYQADGQASTVVIKCHAINMLYVNWIRQLWPDTPCVVLIRDPLEVIMSNLAKPAGWVRLKRHTLAAQKTFGWSAADVEKMPAEEYCARVIGRFCARVRESMDEKIKVIDYKDLDIHHIYKIAEFFNVTLPAPNSTSIRQAMATYSKDLRAERLFEEDQARKQRDATASVRRAASLWTNQPYHSLKEAISW